MTFWEHVYEIRNRLLIVLICFLFFSVFCYIIFPVLFKAIYTTISEELFVTNIAEGFITRLRVGILGGLFLSIPIFIFQLILFVFPALRKNEKVFMLLLLISTFILFVFGIGFAYKSVLPVAIQFLKSKEFFPENVRRIIPYESFVVFFFQFLIGFGVCFQFPVVLVFLMKIKLLKLKTLIKNFKYVIAIIFIVAAILTPTPDVVSQVLLAIPMLILYALCIFIGVIFRLGK
jgi:sec-independent protein translocase protein TatC